jgi:DNA-binding transcriptional ArsR family regulator
MANNYTTLDTLFHALADSTRRQVLEQLAEGPQSVSALARPFSMALPSFMQHIRILEECGLIRTQKQGRVRLCEMNTGSLAPAEDWISGQRDIWQARLDRLDSLLTSMDATDRTGEADGRIGCEASQPGR